MSNDNSEQITKDNIRRTFEAVADNYGKGGAKFFHAAGEYIANSLNLQGNEHILDVASGTGATAIPLAKKLLKGKVTAVDFSSAMLDQARQSAEQKNLHNIDYQVHDMTAMPFSEGQFDIATCSFGVFFVEDMVSLLTHIASKVKPEGRVIISGFCNNSFIPQTDILFEQLHSYGVDIPENPIGWKRMAEPGQLHELFNNAGLKQIEIHRQSLGYYVDLEQWWELVWNAGFRGMVAQLGDRLEEFKQEHFAELKKRMNDKGLWVEIDVNFTQGTV